MKDYSTLNAEELIDSIMHRYYYVHHDKARYRKELTEAAVGKVSGFFEAKRQVVEALDHHIAQLSLKVIADRTFPGPILEELKRFRRCVKGLVIKAK